MNEKSAYLGGEEWRKSAKCNGTSPELFFPASEAEQEAVKLFCAGCPVQVACLEYALETRQDHGVWGGTTEADRRRLIKQSGNKRKNRSNPRKDFM